jgi:hypothetical protein
VIVEPKGHNAQGYRFQIVLDSSSQGTESSLDLVAAETALLVTARDVDGIGNDLDLIIKTAWSSTPVGVWINDHHGGFIKADARVYASSIWSDSPLLCAAKPTESLRGAILASYQSHVQPPVHCGPGKHGSHQDMVERTGLDALARLATAPNQTRAPPSPSLLPS